jgi:hypothetical protein
MNPLYPTFQHIVAVEKREPIIKISQKVKL